MKTGRGGSLTHKPDQLMVAQVTPAQRETLLERLFYRRSLISALGAMTNPGCWFFFFALQRQNEMKLAESWHCHMTCSLCLPARIQAMAPHAVVQDDREVMRAQVEPGPMITWRFQQVTALKTETLLASLRVTSAHLKEAALLQQQQHHAHTDQPSAVNTTQKSSSGCFCRSKEN